MDGIAVAQTPTPATATESSQQNTTPSESPSVIVDKPERPGPYTPGANTNTVGEAHAWANDIIRFVETPNGIAIIVSMCLLAFGLWKAYLNHKAEMVIKVAAFRKQKSVDEANETLLSRLEKQVASLQSQIETATTQRNADWNSFWKIRREDQEKCDVSIEKEVLKREELRVQNSHLEKQNEGQARQIETLQSDMAGLSKNVGTLWEELQRRRAADNNPEET